MANNTIEGSTFRELLLRDAPELSDTQLDACQIDLVSMAEEEGFTSEAPCYAEWTRRINRQFRTYADVMIIQQRKG
jgi:hypothetical protein